MNVLDRLEKWAGHRFVHDPVGDPVGVGWIMAFLGYIGITLLIMKYVPETWPLFVYSYIVGILMAFFSIRSQLRRMKSLS